MNINLTLLGQIISFSIFIWFCLKYVWPPLIKAMEDRQNRIAAGLQEAEKAKFELDNAEQAAESTLKQAKDQAAALIQQANKRAEQIIEEAKGQAIEEGDRLKAQADADIQREFNLAKEKLLGDLSGLVVLGAEKILNASVDQKMHKKLLKDLATQL